MKIPKLASIHLTLAVLACAPAASKPDAAASTVPVDSVVLERTVCFGFCPAYRLRITSAEEIRFESHNRGDSSNVVVDTASRGTYASIVSRAREIDFYSLPPDIQKDSVFCRRYATDLPTVITTIYSGATTKRVSDYHGCFQVVEKGTNTPFQKLRDFENEIDSTLHSSRWVRPNRAAK